MTTLERICEKFVEAGWLMASVVVATFLNPFSDQVFEPDKAALLRILVVLMVAAWVIRSLDDKTPASSPTSAVGGAGHAIARAVQALREAPIAGLALLLLLAYLVSTITSISPRVSWWGSYQRTQGAYTFLVYLGLFFVVLSTLRDENQLRRLMTVLLFTSFPVALYAVLQRYGMSLLQFSEGGIEARVISTLGNAIFLAAYLAMVVPLTLWRLMEAVGEWPRSPVRAAIETLLYGGLLVLQLAAIVFTQSRGPGLGLLIELFVFVLLVALLRRQRRWALAGILVSGGTVVLLLLLNVPGLPTGPLRKLPYVARFAELAGAGDQTMQARALAWNTVLDAIRADPLRMVVGYGPETMKNVLTRFMPAELWVLQGGGQYGTFDRAHNTLFDALFASGVGGALVYLLLYGLIFFQALRWLGVVRTRREAGALIGLLVGGALLGVFLPWLGRGGFVLAAVGIPTGMIAGMVLYLLGRLAFLPPGEAASGDRYRLLLAALLAAIVGHFVEAQTGIEIVVTRSYFWLYTALVILLGTGRISASEPVPSAAPSVAPSRGQSVSKGMEQGRFRRSRRGSQRASEGNFPLSAEVAPLVAAALVAAALLGTLSYAFVHGFNVPGARGPAQLLITVTWLFAGSTILLEQHRSGSNTQPLSSGVLVYAITSLAWLLPFALYHRSNAQTLDQLNVAYLVLVVWLLLTVAGIAAALQWGRKTSSPVAWSSRLALDLMIVVLALIMVWKIDVTRVQADIHEKVGKTAMGAGLWDQAIPNLQRAVALQPGQDQYYILLGGAYVEQARITPDVATKEAWMERARQVLEQGQSLAPRASDHPRQLGLAHRVWAEWAQDDTTRRQRLQQSLSYYLAAVDLNPENPDLRLDLADAYFALEMNDEALAQYQHAVVIGSPAHLGRAYAGLGDVYLVRHELDAALEAYRQAMGVGRDRQEVLESRIRVAGKYPKDIQVHLSLALVYVAADRQADALEELSAALEMASGEAERAEVEKLMAKVTSKE